MKGEPLQANECPHQHSVGQPAVVYGPRNKPFHSFPEIAFLTAPRYFKSFTQKKGLFN